MFKKKKISEAECYVCHIRGTFADSKKLTITHEINLNKLIYKCEYCGAVACFRCRSESGEVVEIPGNVSEDIKARTTVCPKCGR